MNQEARAPRPVMSPASIQGGSQTAPPDTDCPPGTELQSGPLGTDCPSGTERRAAPPCTDCPPAPPCSDCPPGPPYTDCPPGTGRRTGADEPIGEDTLLPADAPTVIVIGAGVSGCACAASLAAAGLRVTLLNSAMDRVGLPSYGPDMMADHADVQRLLGVFSALPEPLRAVWLDSSWYPSSGRAIVNVDRRRLSVEAKRTLEQVPGLLLRQGFVVDLRIAEAAAASEGARRKVQVETIFGEIFEADAAVVAVGLSLQGRSIVGGEEIEGARYGEPASDDLAAALHRLGAQFEQTVLDVGPRVAARDLFTEQSGRPRLDGMVEELLVAAGRPESPETWPADYPPAPHLDTRLRLASMWRADHEGSVGTHAAITGSARAAPSNAAAADMAECGATPAKEGGALWPAMSPDGAATAEIYISPGLVAFDTWSRAQSDASDGESSATGGEQGDAWAPTRMPVQVQGKVITRLSDRGRLLNNDFVRLPVWVVGRAAGAADYSACLLSGTRGAADIISSLVGGGAR